MSEALHTPQPAFETREDLVDALMGARAWSALLEGALEEVGPEGAALVEPEDEALVDLLVGAWALLRRVDAFVEAATAETPVARPAVEAPSLGSLLR